VPVAKQKEIVLVVADDEGFRKLARVLLERASFRVVEAANVDEALAAAEETRPHLVLLDIRIPETSGYEIYRELRDLCGSKLRIIFVTGERTDAYDRSVGLLLGADDYLIKPFDPGELIARVQRCLSRGPNGHQAEEPAPDDALEKLTPREREVLALLAAGRSSAQIAHELLVAPRTLATHVQHILTKLHVHNRTQAVAVAHRAKLSLPDVQEHAQLSASFQEPGRTKARAVQPTATSSSRK